MTHTTAYSKPRPHARQKRQQPAQRRHRQKERERLEREQARAQRCLRALEEAIADLGLPETVAAEVQWQLQAQQNLVGKIFGLMFPPGVWLPQLPGAVPGPRLGQTCARPDPGGLA